MQNPATTTIDPLQIFMQGDGFFKTFSLLSSDKLLEGDPTLAVSIGSAVMVLSASNSELFL
jgi:hypothetical protein